MTQVKCNAPQGLFLQLPQKFKAFVGGYGSGKTWVGCQSKCIHFVKFPKITQGYFGPTYPHIRDIFYPTIEEVAHSFGLTTEIREGNREVHYYNGGRYVGTTIARSMDNPGSIVGFKIGHALVDEFDVMERLKSTTAWRKIVARMRYKDDRLRNGIDVTTTPEGFKETYRLFVEEVSKKPQLYAKYGMVQASTYQNAKNLPADYIQSLLDAYPEELVNAYVMGQFVNLTTGTVYRSYNRYRHASHETVKPKEPLHIGMDFNVGKMAAVVYVVRLDGWHAVAEVTKGMDTPHMIESLKLRWPNNPIAIYPDASGQNTSSKSASDSDVSLLRAAGFTVHVNPANPRVRDRILATNKLFETDRLFVNVQGAPVFASCLEKQAYNEHGEPDKKGGFDHSNDAGTYPIAYKFPVRKPTHSHEVEGV